MARQIRADVLNMAYDEFGRPILILKEQDQKKRIKGMEAYKANILACISVANTVRTSLGPKGMDKILISPDGDITVTNDGATILEKMDVSHETAKLLVELSKGQDDEIGDGTTGVVVLAGAILQQAQKLLDRGFHPLRIADGFEKSCDIACTEINNIAQVLDIENRENLVNAAMVALGSKIVSLHQRKLAEIAVDAVLSVADLKRKDVNFEHIKIETKPGGSLEETQLIKGIVIDKDFSHPQMPKQVKDAKLCILTCAFEPPKPKTKHKIEIKTGQAYLELYEQEQEYFKNQIRKVQESGSNLVICQWGFDDEANHLLYQNNLPAIRWVGGVEIELIAMATGARIVPRFEELTAEKLGTAGIVREINIGTGTDKMIVIQETPHANAVTIVVRGGSKTIVEEAKRSLHDAICVVRNLIKDNKIIYGGGAVEIAVARVLENVSFTISSIESHVVKSYAEALLSIPLALAENSGLKGMESVADVKALQTEKNANYFGIDCTNQGHNDMRQQNVWETARGKIQQLQLATQVAKMILKIDDIITPAYY